MEGHTGVFNINYIPTKKLSFNIASAYTDSKAHIEAFNFAGPLEYAPETDGARERYYNYDFSNVADYSDLHIRELDLTLSASYIINKNFALSAGYNYLYYGNADPYLYDGTGRAHIGMLTLNYWY
ncbi:MAG TPA: hypothetical protein ENJ03_00455 [Candidatus Desulfofervidus auxilii]|uniref:TonB-dependent receptor n=1 Tax=Desulfofervidus auxilii TaxID=1621989 RepID=A0A7V1I3J2_DESA2|nr:hypothetical protein [Candidatus Desulfofervidus auxilii]